MEGMIKGGGALHRVAELFLDGKAVEIPSDVTGIILVNIASYGGGTDPWGLFLCFFLCFLCVFVYYCILCVFLNLKF